MGDEYNFEEPLFVKKELFLDPPSIKMRIQTAIESMMTAFLSEFDE